jgi:phosphatidylserine decarboxylase
VRYVPGLFARNERVTMHLESDELGPVCLVMVGAVGVGRITVTFDDLTTNVRGARSSERAYDPSLPIARGEEIGAFHLGSTVVLFFARGRAVAVGPDADRPIRMGEPIARALESA